MKIRNGFVSNSSTSSFVIATALVLNKETCDKILNEDIYDYEFYTGKELLDLSKSNPWNNPMYIENDWVSACASQDKNFLSEHLEDTFVSFSKNFGDYHDSYSVEEEEEMSAENLAYMAADNDLRIVVENLKQNNAISNLQYDIAVGFNG